MLYSIDQIKQALKQEVHRLTQKAKKNLSEGKDYNAQLFLDHAYALRGIIGRAEEIFSEVFPEGGDETGGSEGAPMA